MTLDGSSSSGTTTRQRSTFTCSPACSSSPPAIGRGKGPCYASRTLPQLAPGCSRGSGQDPRSPVTRATICSRPGWPLLERLIVCTALGRDLDSRRSAQRFERDTYHGDALPTELRGRVLSCLTWGFAPYSGLLRSCTAVLPIEHHRGAARGHYRPRRDYRTPAVGASPPGGVRPLPRTNRAYTDDGAPGQVPGRLGNTHGHAHHPAASTSSLWRSFAGPSSASAAVPATQRRSSR